MRGHLAAVVLLSGGLAVPTACGGDDGGSGSGGGTATGGSGGGAGSGASGGSAGSSGGAAGAGATDGGNQAQCQALQQDYLTELEKARTCDPAASTNECTTKVDNAISCPCPTMANATKTAELAKLADLKKQWTDLGCDVGVGCPPVACQEPTGGTCKQDPTSGKSACRDLL